MASDQKADFFNRLPQRLAGVIKVNPKKPTAANLKKQSGVFTTYFLLKFTESQNKKLASISKI
jgi:hypothetical protein